MPNNPKDARIYMVSHCLYGSTAATAANYNAFFIADRKCVVKEIRVVWATGSTSGTLQVERLQGTEANGNGDNLLGSTVDLSGTKDTVKTPTLTTTTSNLVLDAGDRLSLVDGGTLTSQTDLVVTVLIEQVD